MVRLVERQFAWAAGGGLVGVAGEFAADGDVQDKVAGITPN